LSLGSFLALIPSELSVLHVAHDADIINVVAGLRSTSAACPVCQQASTRLHSRYDRKLADLPWQGRQVTITVQARRFRCATVGCDRKVFGERLDGVAACHARRSSRLVDIQRHIGLALGGAAGARLAGRLALPVSGATLLRLIRRHVSNEALPAPRVIGIDDWAWKRGQRYGSVVCDLERRQIIDLLPDRAIATVEAWLAARPEIRIIARDRGSGYGPAASRASPQAVQVADRWHLMENASAAFLEAVRRSMPSIRNALGTTNVNPTVLTCAERRQYDGFLRREQITASVQSLAKAGRSIKEIVRQTGHSRKLVRQAVRGSLTDVFRSRTSSLEKFLPRLEAEWKAGCHNGAELWRRLRADGFGGGQRVVTEWATRRRREEGTSSAILVKVPSARAIARLMTGGRNHLAKSDAIIIDVIERVVPNLVAARDLLDRFQEMIRGKKSDALDQWLTDAGRSLLSSFAAGIIADQSAVAAAMTEPWSNGQTEGQITKLKLMKRQMYGRARLDLLRARLCAA
jgi:transposase